MINEPSTDKENLVNQIVTRGVEAVYPSREALKERLLQKEPIKIYLGIDPTGPTLHIGHAITLRRLRDFQRAGQKVILLIGDFTALIGDPTDKENARSTLTREQVLKNATLYKQQASRFLNFEGENEAELKYNSSWLGQMNFEDVLRLCAQTTVQAILKRDMFEKRMAEGRPVFLHEFLYPLMQGYDSVAMNVDAEIGGNDQTFNMLAGRDLSKSLNNKDKFVVAVKLLVDPTGKKMGKSEGNMIALTDSAEEMVGKVMRWTDGMIVPGFELCTDVSMDEIEQIKKRLGGGANPFEIKMNLAVNIAGFYHGEEAANKAKEGFLTTFSKGSFDENALEIKTALGTLLSDVLVANNIIESKTEFKRMVADGAISKDDDTKISDPAFAISESIKIKVGKRRFVSIQVG